MRVLYTIIAMILLGVLSYPVILILLAKKNAHAQLQTLKEENVHLVESVNIAAEGDTKEDVHIDYVVIGQAGVFLVHTTTKMGTITGEEPDDYWTSTSFGRAKRFENPTKTNLQAMKALRRNLDVTGYVPMYSVVSFPNKAKFHNLFTESAVISHNQLASFIRGFADNKLSEDEVKDVYDQIKKL